MIETALVFPLLPGKRPALEQFVQTLLTERCAEHDRTHRGIYEERWFVQPTPSGEVVIVTLCGTDPALVFYDLAISEEPFEIWFREQVLEITGVNLTRVPPFSQPECVFHRSRPAAASVPEEAVVLEAIPRNPPRVGTG